MYADNAKAATRAPLTVPALRRMKAAGERIAALTAYDASFARALDAAGIDLILVGDSLGMVVQGHTSTLPVSVDDIVYHTACVARGLHAALLVADMPFQSYATPERALDAATRMLAQGGASMVKLEGAGPLLESIRFLSERDIPVCAHLGLTPQSVLRLGGYRVQGREQAAAERMRADARAVADAGADLLVLECVPSALAAEVTADLAIPTIGIGAGPDCDGQILVLHDMLGLNSGHRRPRFVRDFLADGGSIDKALEAYVRAVKAREFPTAGHGYE
ncbi:MAG: 3-methyl-2-oxobutanoate hydroxymethyltransferase [Arenimonas sp.]